MVCAIDLLLQIVAADLEVGLYQHFVDALVVVNKTTSLKIFIRTLVKVALNKVSFTKCKAYFSNFETFLLKLIAYPGLNFLPHNSLYSHSIKFV